MPFGVGETIGPYQILQQLGQGGMATVYKAYHPALDRYVAIKALHPAFMDDPNFLARFQREARVVARLEHPNIVPIFDFAEHEGRPYLVMKYIEGETLKAALERNPLSAEEILRVVEAVGSALAYAHQRDILHRDIKPSNVLLAADGQIYLADFGLARIAQSGETTLTSDRMVGTPQYISPEQAMSRPDLDARTDIYSLGVMVYEMVVGRVPFSADTPFAVIHDHIYSPLPPPRTINADVSPAVERVLLKALAKDPLDRFSEVSIFVQAFRVAMETPPALAPETTSPLSASTPTSLPVQNVPVPPAAEAKTEIAKPGSRRWSTGRIIILAGIALMFLAFLFRMVSWQKKIRTAESSTATAAVLVVTETNNSLPSTPDAAVSWQELNRTATALAELSETQAALLAQSTLPAVPPRPLQPSKTPDLTSTAAAPTADQFFDGAIASWRLSSWESMHDNLRLMVIAAGDDREFYQHVYQVVMDKEAYPIGFDLMLNPVHPLPYDLAAEDNDRAHLILYRCALDPMVAEIIAQPEIEPMFVVGRVRYQAYYGDLNAAKRELGLLQGSNLVTKKFPEMKLLEAEILLLQNDIRALDLLQSVIDDTTLPQWVRDEAKIIQDTGLPEINKP